MDTYIRKTVLTLMAFMSVNAAFANSLPPTPERAIANSLPPTFDGRALCKQTIKVKGFDGRVNMG